MLRRARSTESVWEERYASVSEVIFVILLQPGGRRQPLWRGGGASSVFAAAAR